MSESPGDVVRQRGLWFEELQADVVYKHSPGRAISEADNTLFFRDARFSRLSGTATRFTGRQP